MAGKRLVSETLKVRTSLGGRTEIDLSALIDNDDLVEEGVDALTGLVEGDEGGLAEDVGHDPQRLDEIQGGTGVQASSGIVPGLNAGTCGHHLCDRHSLSFTAADTANERIADECLLGMGDIEHAEKEISDIIDECLALDARKTPIWAGGFSGQSEIERLADGQRGDVIII